MQTSVTPPATSPNGSRSIVVFRGLVTLLLVVAVIIAVTSLVRVFATSQLAYPLELGVPGESIDLELPQGASIDEADALVNVEAGLGLRLLWWLVTDATAIVGIAFLVLVRQMLAKGAEPFTEQNATRLQRLTGLTIAFACFDGLRPIVSVLVQDASGFEGFEASWDFSSLFAALLLAALLEVWRHGVAIRTEHELTI